MGISLGIFRAIIFRSGIVLSVIGCMIMVCLMVGCAGKQKSGVADLAEPYQHASPRFWQEKVVVEKHSPPTRSEPLSLPGFVLAVPSGHFAGISQPSPTIASARQSAIADVVGQVVGTMNSKVRALYKERMQVDGLGSRNTVDDYINILSEGLVVGVEQDIVDAVMVTDALGRYVCYLLVRYPAELINEMRRLSLGANIVPSFEGSVPNGIKIRVRETNNVGVTLSSAEVTVEQKNRHAGFINYYIWKVPDGESQTMQLAFDPVEVCGGVADVVLPVSFDFKPKLKDRILGSKYSFNVRLLGVDEIGREINSSIKIKI